jgi:hypothetical protein
LESSSYFSKPQTVLILIFIRFTQNFNKKIGSPNQNWLV